MNQLEPKPRRPNYWLDEEPGGYLVRQVPKRWRGKVRLKRDNRRKFRAVEKEAELSGVDGETGCKHVSCRTRTRSFCLYEYE